MPTSALIISIGFLGDGILASSFAENCKLNGFDRVDLLVGWPHLIELLQNNSKIDNVYIHQVGSHPEIPKELIDFNYTKIYKIDHLVFNEKPIDTFNKGFGSNMQLKYDFTLYPYEVEMPKKEKLRLAFQADWSDRSFSKNRQHRDVTRIIDELSTIYDVYLVGGGKHYDINQDTPIDFIRHCALIKECDLFFGYPGGMHWVAGGVRTPTITTSEHVVNHYTNNGEFKGNSFEEFKTQWMVHTSKHFPEQDHILLEPEISDDKIIEELLKYGNILQNKQ